MGIAVEARAASRESGLVARSRAIAARLSWSTVAISGISAVAAVFFVANAVTRWRDYQTNAFDLAFFDQIIWNTSRGDWFETNFVAYNFAGQHMEPILLLFVPFYWFGGGPLVLLVVQSVGVALATPLLYAASRGFGLPKILALAVAASFLVNPYLHRAVDFDFHPEVLVAIPVFAAAWAVSAKRYRLASALAISALLFKEDAAFVVLALAGLLWFEGAKKPALVTATVGIAYAVVIVLVVMPLIRDGAPSDLVERYGYLVGTSNQAEFLPRLLSRPWVIPQHLFAPAQLWTAGLLLAITAPLAMLRPHLLLFILPGLAVALLASHPEQRALELHYSAEIVPLIVLFGLLGVRTALRRVPQPVVATAIVLPVLLGFFAISPFSPFQDRSTLPTSEHRDALDAAVALVPQDPAQSVAAQSGILPRLSQRRDAREFPGGATSADWVVVDRYGHISGQSQPEYESTLAEVRATFERVYERDGVEVFRRIE